MLQPGAIAASWRLPGGRWQVFANFGEQALPLPAERGTVVHAENVPDTGSGSLPPDGFLACWMEGECNG